METEKFRPLEVTYTLNGASGRKVQRCDSQESFDTVLTEIWDKGGDIQCRYTDIAHVEFICGAELNRITARPSRKSA